MIIAHRVNFFNERSTEVFSIADGIEFDIRDDGGEIIVQHDAFTGGQLFSVFLSFCDPSKFYIVNVKSEGIEERALALLEKFKISNFFLLDCSIPAIVKLGKRGEKRIAVRFSEYESAETVLAMANFVSWVWVDVFTCLPLLKKHEVRFREAGLKLCMVSPELQAQPEKLDMYKAQLELQDIKIDAVCTKIPFIDAWRGALSLYPS